MFIYSLLFLTSLVAAAKTNGCGKAGQLSNGPGTFMGYPYILHLPPNYQASSNAGSGMIVAFPGYGGDPEVILKRSRYNDDSLNPNLVSVFTGPPPERPQKINHTWEGEYPFPQADDVSFVDEFLTMLSNNLCLDSSRFYASGFSNGGGFTNSLACDPTAGHRFAAFGIHSGAFWHGSENLNNNSSPGTGCEPGRAVTPILDIHGADDTNISYDGNDRGIPDNGNVLLGIRPSIPVWFQRWAVRNNCPDPANPKSAMIKGGGATFYDFVPGCNLAHYKVAGLTHEWATLQNSAIDATTKFLAFFNSHSLPAAS